MKTVHREKLNEAPYNPRKISKHAEKKLREGIERDGLVIPLTWNERTGHLVAGHQRLKQLDKIEGHKNYTLEVAVIDVDEKDEKQLNVFLNNSDVMGEWDTALLEELLKTPDLDVFSTGFDAVNLEVLMPNTGMTALFEAEGKKAETDEDWQRIKDIKQKKKEAQEKREEKEDTEFYKIVVFDNREEGEKFLTMIEEKPGMKYVDGQKLMTYLENCSDG